MVWTPEAEIELLAWLERNKGASGNLRTDESGALNGLFTDATFAREHPKAKSITKYESRRTYVMKQLKLMWPKLRQNPKETRFTWTYLYDKGPVIFDWNLLLKSFPGIADDKRFDAIKQAAKSAPRSTSSPGRKRGRDGADPQVRNTRSKTQASAPSDEDGDADQDAPRNTHGPNLDTNTEPAQQEVSEEERLRNQDSLLSNIDFLQLERIKDFVSEPIDGTQDKHTEDSAEILKVFNSIRKTVETFVQDSQLDLHRLVVLEPASIYPDSLQTLLSYMLGGGTLTVNTRIHTSEKLQQHNVIDYQNFFRSLLAAAVYKWVLSQSINEAKVYRDLGQGIVSEVLGSTLEDILEDKLREKFFHRYVDKHLKPLIPAQAREMAHRFQTYMFLLTPRIEGVPHVASEQPATFGRSMDASKSQKEKEIMEVFSEPLHWKVLRGSLIDIFQSALEWRVERHKYLFNKYTFKFMSMGTMAFTSDVVLGNDWDEPREVEDDKWPVRLCLWPVTYRAEKETIGQVIDFSEATGQATDEGKKIVNGFVI